MNSISYKVFCIRVRIDLSPNNMAKLLNVSSATKSEITSIFQLLSKGGINRDLLDNPELEGILGIEERSEKVFTNDNPIESRREAVSYAESLNDVIKQAGEFFRPSDAIYTFEKYGVYPTLKAVDYKLNLFAISMTMHSDSIRLVVGATPPHDNEMPDRLEKEYLLYKEYGYEIGGEGPFEYFVPDYGRRFMVLPDVKASVK